jgi:hypothetical protein
MSKQQIASEAGRPSTLTTDTAIRLGFALGRGMTIPNAAAYAGVARTSCYRWLALGRAGDPRYVALALAVARQPPKVKLFQTKRKRGTAFWDAFSGFTGNGSVND